MNTRILIVTVGGSCAPVVRAIQQYEPDLVYFEAIQKRETKDERTMGSDELA